MPIVPMPKNAAEKLFCSICKGWNERLWYTLFSSGNFLPGSLYQAAMCVRVCVWSWGVCVCHGAKFKKYFNSTFCRSLEKKNKWFEFWTQILKCCVCTKLFYIISTFKPSVIVFNLIRSNSDCLSNLKIAKYSSEMIQQWVS